MSRHGEKIRKRTDGRWEGRYKTGNSESGRTLYTSVYGHSYAEVRRKLEEKLYGAGEDPSFPAPTVREVAREWLEVNHRKIKGATETKYEFLIEKHIIPDLGSLKITDIGTIQLNRYCEQKLAGDRIRPPLAPSYVRSIMLLVNSIYNYAVSEKICPPLNTPVFMPSVKRNEIRILQKSEQAALEKCLRTNTDRTKLGILISLYTGLRIGEICALRWEDIDMANEVIHVRATVSRVKSASGNGKSELTIDLPKTGSSIRKIPIPNTLLRILGEFGEADGSEYVVSSKKMFLSPRTYEYRFHRILNSCSIASINYHALRHTFATRCVEVGVDVKSLSEILGHSNVAITLNTYVHPSMELKRAQINKLEAVLNAENGQTKREMA